MPPKRAPGYAASTPRDLAEVLPTRIPSTPVALSPDTCALTERQLTSAKKRAQRRDSFVAANSAADKVAVIEGTMKEASEMLAGGITAEDFNEAALAFSDVLEMAPGNQAAKAGLRAALAKARVARKQNIEQAREATAGEEEALPSIASSNGVGVDNGLSALLGATRRVQLTRKFTQLREALTTTTNLPDHLPNIYTQHDDTATGVGQYYAAPDPSWPTTADTSGMIVASDAAPYGQDLQDEELQWVDGLQTSVRRTTPTAPAARLAPRTLCAPPSSLLPFARFDRWVLVFGRGATGCRNVRQRRRLAGRYPPPPPPLAAHHLGRAVLPHPRRLRPRLGSHSRREIKHRSMFKPRV